MNVGVGVGCFIHLRVTWTWADNIQRYLIGGCDDADEWLHNEGTPSNVESFRLSSFISCLSRALKWKEHPQAIHAPRAVSSALRDCARDCPLIPESHVFEIITALPRLKLQ